MRTIICFFLGVKNCSIKSGLVFWSACKKFYLDNCFLYTASLTYHSLLSIVPVIAMAFAVAKGFGMESYLREYLLEAANQNEIFLQVLSFSEALLNRTRGGIIAGIGIVVLLWSLWSVLNNIESSFNIIWKTKNDRSLMRKLSDYISIIFLSPIILILALGGVIYMESFVKTTLSPFPYAYMIMYALRLLPVCFLILLFTGLYMLLPNTRVPFLKALPGAAFTAIAFQLFTYIYIHYQIKLTSYNIIYGSLAALPLLFLWLYYTWVIILLGMELVIIYHNYSISRHRKFHIKLSAYHKKLLSLAILKMLIENFKRPEKKPLTLSLLSKKLSLPLKTTEKLLSTLTQLGYITEIMEKEHTHTKEPCFQPAYDIHEMRVGDILLALDTFSTGTYKINWGKHREKYTEKIHNVLDQWQLLAQNNQHNIRLADL